MRSFLLAIVVVASSCRPASSQPGNLGRKATPEADAAGQLTPIAYRGSVQELTKLGEPWPAAGGYLDTEASSLYVPSDDGSLVALQLDKGKLRWKRPSTIAVRGLRGAVLGLELSGKDDLVRSGGQACRGDRIRVVIVGADGKLRYRSVPLAVRANRVVVPFDSRVSGQQVEVAWCEADNDGTCHSRRWRVGLDGLTRDLKTLSQQRLPFHTAATTAAVGRPAHTEHASAVLITELVAHPDKAGAARLSIKKSEGGAASAALMVEEREMVELHLAHRHAREAYLVLNAAKQYYRLDIASMTLSESKVLGAPVFMGAIARDMQLSLDRSLGGPYQSVSAVEARRLSDSGLIWRSVISEARLPGTPLPPPAACSPVPSSSPHGERGQEQ